MTRLADDQTREPTAERQRVRITSPDGRQTLTMGRRFADTWIAKGWQVRRPIPPIQGQALFYRPIQGNPPRSSHVR